MPEVVWAIIGIVLGIVLGFVIARYVANGTMKRQKEEIETVLSDARRQAETIKREAEVEAKDEALKLKAEIETERKERQREVREAEHRVQQREESTIGEPIRSISASTRFRRCKARSNAVSAISRQPRTKLTGASRASRA